MGADPPRSKNVFLRAPWAIKIVGQIGGLGPLSGFPPKLPHPQNFNTPISQNLVVRISPKAYGGDQIAEVYFVQIWAKVQLQKS